MGKNTSISLSEYYQDFIKKGIDSGRYSNASEVIREGLRHMIRLDEAREELDELLEEGSNSGIAEDFSFDSFRAKMEKKYGDKRSA